MATPLLGWISPSKRTQQQHDAHARAVAKMPRFALAPPTLAKGERVKLYSAWRNPTVISDVGITFPRFRQLTGSCVGVGGGNTLFTLAAIQRLFATAPTKVFVPWWPHAYGISRLLMGDHSQGDGSMGSTFADAVRTHGVFDMGQPGLPSFDTSDGLALTSSQEMQWSDGDSPTVSKWDALAKTHLVGATAECRDAASIKAAILNGYPVTFACNNYIGKASVQGSGSDACVVGYWDGSGGHQQSVHAYWEHPNLGPLYWVQNSWAGSTYPTDPAGGPICGCWVTEAKVNVALKMEAEVYAFSALNWFPAQPSILDWGNL